MSAAETRARRRERDRAAYARDPEKFRALSREALCDEHFVQVATGITLREVLER